MIAPPDTDTVRPRNGDDAEDTLQRYARARCATDPVAVFVPPSREQLFWAGALEGLVSPPDNRGSLAARMIARVGVTPIAHLAWFSLTFQTYLYELFHQTHLARICHFVLMPLVLMAGMVSLAPLTLLGAHPTEHAPVLFAWNGGLVLAVLLGVWYLAEAVAERMWLWGAVMVGVVAALYMGSNLIYYQNFLLAPDRIGWVASLPLNPLLWIAGLSLAIALSHVLEPRLPPRVSKTSHWMPIVEFVRGPSHQAHPLGTRVARALDLVLQIIFGALDELWATPRLFPIGVLRQMWRMGYQVARQRQMAALVERALREGNPALDFIGTGGGAFLQVPKAG